MTYVANPPGASMRLQLEHAEARLARALEELDGERRAVGEIQRSLLPAVLPEIPGLEMSAYYRPSDRAGGDYYDVVPLVGDLWGFVMADVAGHGTPAAVIMTVMRTLIHANLPDTRDKPPGEFLRHVNEVMSKTYLRDGRFVTVWAGMFDPARRTFTYSSAGHHPPRLFRGNDVLELDAARGLPLGIEVDTTYEVETIALQPDDLLVIYTDGITEAMRPGLGDRELFGTERLDRALAQRGPADRADDCAERVTRALAAFTGGTPPTDDQTLLVLRASGFQPQAR